MNQIYLRRSIVLMPLLALPASAQQPPTPVAREIPGSPAENPTVVDPPHPRRAGLFCWRQRHAECKSRLQEKVLGYPEEFNEWPLGSSLYACGRREVANSAAARQILNHYDFVGDTTELNVRGRDKLESIAAQLPTNFAPVYIERTPWAPEVAEARRLMVMNKLAEGPFPVPPERIIVAPAPSRGISGVEAIIVNTNRLNSLEERGTGINVNNRMAVPRF